MRIRLSTLRKIIRETVEEQMGADPLKSYLASDPKGNLFHMTKDGVVRVGEGYVNDPEVPAAVAEELARLLDWSKSTNGYSVLSIKDLSENLDEYRGMMASGTSYPDKTVFGQRPRRPSKTSVFSTQKDRPGMTSYGPGDSQTWPSHLRRR